MRGQKIILGRHLPPLAPPGAATESDAFSERLFQLFITFLPLIVVPKNANTLLLFIHDTIVFQNLLDKIRFPTLCGTHNQKWEFVAEVEFRTWFGYHGCCYFPRGFFWLSYRTSFLANTSTACDQRRGVQDPGSVR